MNQTHYENANFLRELAENLKNISPKAHKPERVELLQRLADEELEQARYDEWIKNKVTAARADKRPGMNTNQVRRLLRTRYEYLRSVL